MKQPIGAGGVIAIIVIAAAFILFILGRLDPIIAGGFVALGVARLFS